MTKQRKGRPSAPEDSDVGRAADAKGPQDAGEAVEAGDLWRNPAGTPGRGLQTAEDVQRPRDAEAGMDIVPGFTTTSVTGSQSGRSVHGIVPGDLPADRSGEEGEEET